MKYCKSNSTTIALSSIKSVFAIPIDGSYYIELHSNGGTAGRNYSYYDGFNYQHVGGGGGGGSGAQTTEALQRGAEYNISVGAQKTVFGDYYVNCGSNGGNATISPGAGGSYGSTNITNIATAGQRGQVVSMTPGAGGTGGATIGSYGNAGTEGAIIIRYKGT